jgi:succinylglutamic semialdehyde dehydrogenase
MTDRCHYIGNRWTAGAGPFFASEDPATDETTWEGRAAAAAEVDRAVAAARDAFEEWAATPLSGRVRLLEAFRDRLAARRSSLAEAISRETGKPLWESYAEVDGMAVKVAVSVDACHDRCRVVRGVQAGGSTATRFKPHGVTAVFGPFNMPGHLPTGHIVPALLAGNTAVFKPSELAPLVGRMIAEAWESAGIPPGVFNMIQGGAETGAALAAHPGLDGLFFTGSAETGRSIHRAYGGRPETILALEMGGNNPLVVHEVSDLDAAAYLTVQSAFLTAGQRCSCARRLIVPRGNQGDRFVERLLALTGRIRVSRFTDVPEPFMGPVISRRAAEGLLKAREALAARGGVDLAAMEPVGGRTAMLRPGLMDVTAVADRPDVELFGPFLLLIRVPDFEAALQEANNTAYGLAAGLLSDSRELYERFYRKVRAGVLNWNRQLTGASGYLPFGGVGISGNHRPGAYFAADYCSYPVASIELSEVRMPERLIPGIGP